MAKRVELSIGDYADRSGRPTVASMIASKPGLEPTTTLQARVSFSLADRLRDLARAKSRGGSKVSINALLIEAVGRYLDQEGG